jgi:hypothetical protein
VSHRTKFDRQEFAALCQLEGQALKIRLAQIYAARDEDEIKRRTLRRGLNGQRKTARRAA